MKVKKDVKLSAVPAEPCVDCGDKKVAPAKHKLYLKTGRIFHVIRYGTIGIHISHEGRTAFVGLQQIEQELIESIEANGEDAPVCRIMMELLSDIGLAYRKYGETMSKQVELPKPNPTAQ